MTEGLAFQASVRAKPSHGNRPETIGRNDQGPGIAPGPADILHPAAANALRDTFVSGTLDGPKRPSKRPASERPFAAAFSRPELLQPARVGQHEGQKVLGAHG